MSERELLVHVLFDVCPDDWDENDIGILADGILERLTVTNREDGSAS
jgi:hypothetical protein